MPAEPYRLDVTRTARKELLGLPPKISEQIERTAVARELGKPFPSPRVRPTLVSVDDLTPSSHPRRFGVLVRP